MKYQTLTSLIVHFVAFASVFGFTYTSHAQQRSRPTIDSSLGYNLILTDEGTLLRGVSLAWDGGDPFGSLPKNIPTSGQLQRLRTDFGLNAIHLYLEGNSSQNPNAAGSNIVDADAFVQATADAGLYLILTIGCNGENGTIYDLEFAKDFWSIYASRYRNETHVIYEAHNEPVFNTPNQWTIQDWNKQVELYNTMRAAAPNTLVLLCSFMGFAGDPTFGAQYLENQGVDWSNAGFAHHGYESKAGIENAIAIMQSSTAFPALLSTEFWSGDTDGQGYNSMYESRLNGWMQFQWLGADDEDLNRFKSKINFAGTVWTPDDPLARWPALGSPTVPFNFSTVGLFQREAQRFVRVNSQNNRLYADATTYSGGNAEDSFVIEYSSPRFFTLRTPTGGYVRTTGESGSLQISNGPASSATLFELIQIPNEDYVIRAYSGGGHLIRWDSASNLLYPDADSGRVATSHFTFVNEAGEFPPPIIGAPFFGTPHVVPTRIEAEDYDLGGQGVSYFDSDTNNIGERYRSLEGVDIENTSDVDGGYNVGWISTGEWMDYTIELPGEQSVPATLNIRVATPGSGASLGVRFDGTDSVGTLAVPTTGGYQQWETLTTSFTLDPGCQIMRFENRGNVSFNFNWFEITYDQCPPDFNNDGIVNGADLAICLLFWGPCTGNCPADFNGDDVVNGADLSMILSLWGPCQP